MSDSGIPEIVITIIILYLLFSFFFWIGLFAIIFVILYLFNNLIKYFNFYNKKLYIAVILWIFLIFGISFGMSEILYHYKKIDKQIWDYAIDTSNYITIKNYRGNIKIKPNIENSIQKNIVNNITGKNLTGN